MYVSRSKRMMQMVLSNIKQNKTHNADDSCPSQKKFKDCPVEGEVSTSTDGDAPNFAASTLVPPSTPDLIDELNTKVSMEININAVNAGIETENLPESNLLVTSNENRKSVLQIVHPNSESSENESEEEVDDSDVDPTYEPMNMIPSPNILSTEEESDPDSSIIQMAEIIEKNISQHSVRPRNLHSRKIRQEKRNHGKSYNTVSGKLVRERNITKLSTCMRKCSSKITEDQQQVIFDEYWALGDYNLRRLFVSGLISIENKKTQSLVNLGRAQRNRQYSYKYHLKVNEFTHKVCQKCFKSTLGETDKFLKTVIKHKINSPGITINFDERGKSSPKNKLTLIKIKEITDHIDSFPKYESHYSINKSAQLYLESDLNITKMYQLYCDSHENPVSLSKYTEIFKTKNIKFKKPKVDTCNKCDKLNMQISLASEEQLKELKIIQEQHHTIADLGYSSKRDDISDAKTNNLKKVLVFDLQQVLPTPKLNSNSVAYYKRYLSVYNLTIHDGAIGTAHCYMWHEGSAGRGSNEIASCLYEHINRVADSYTSITLYSDNCFGQNKNSIVAAMMMLMSNTKNGIDYIDHKFLEVGHTHMECDQDHSLIERRKKNSGIQIQHPREWYQFVRSCSTKKKRFEVNEMDGKIRDFKTFVNEKFLFRKVDTHKNKVNWINIKWLRFTKDFGKILYKNTLQIGEPFNEINISKRGINTVNLKDVPLLKGPNLITATKKKDLIDLLNLIDPQYHTFYRSLETVSNSYDNTVEVDFIEDDFDDD